MSGRYRGRSVTRVPGLDSPDAGLRQGNWNFAVVATCDDADGWRTYTDHPEHQRVLVELIRPLLADRAAVQFDTSSAVGSDDA